MSAYHEVESQYLLISLSKIGKEYWLPESTIAKHFRIEEDDVTHKYERNDYMSHFSITVLLSYIRTKVRYAKLKAFIEEHSIKKLQEMQSYNSRDSESLLLFFDLIVCPYIAQDTKEKIAAIFGVTVAELPSIQAVNEYWFTAWGNKFDLGKELDAKRSREVY